MFGMIFKLSVRAVERWMPDPLLFAFILTILSAIAAIVLMGTGPVELVNYWGDSVWELLAFSMQMVLIVVSGFVLSTTPLFSRMLTQFASLATSPVKAILLVSLGALTASWLNWGLGLIVGAILARRIAARVPQVDYRLLVASAYSGWIVFHGGLSGSIPLLIATPDHFLVDTIGVIPASETIFTAFNLFIVISLFIAVPAINLLMLRGIDKPVCVDPEKLKAEDSFPVDPGNETLADKLENSWLLSLLIGGAAMFYVIYCLVTGKSGLNINTINLLFLALGIILHGTPRRFIAALNEGIKHVGAIVIQFPFYAGIMGIMSLSGLSSALSDFFIQVSNADTLPIWSFLSAGVLNLFIPSGGGQWAVQGPIMMEAALQLNADLPRVAMAVAWGDAWTNLIQPFWAVPILAIAGLKARDIMGFCMMQTFASGVLVISGLWLF
ncbi:TIGR00366 family protein [Paracoccus onubensis]|uniref:short-chain fatty acid transporter n=1 Tax=Paracoccus onubensis TaxID=1675788 RepID=UPI00272FE828|nr:TIGR00366 family protein [Paracoccus onubensis]MDP0926183.1 TIGR00366 family protein [Paracoccus onubensis]